MWETRPELREICSTVVFIVLLFVLIVLGMNIKTAAFLAFAGGIATIMSLERDIGQAKDNPTD